MVVTLAETGAALLNPLISLWNSFVDILPGLVSALIVAIFGYIVAVILGHAVHALLEKMGLENQLKKWRLEKGIGGLNLSAVAGAVTKWWIFIAFLSQAVDLVNLRVLQDLIKSLVVWLPNAIVGLIIIIFGLIAMQYVGDRMLRAKIWGIRLITVITKALILFFVAVIALKHMGLDISILENTFLVLVAALALGIAVALGIGLGLGLKKESEDLIKELVKGK